MSKVFKLRALVREAALVLVALLVASAASLSSSQAQPTGPMRCASDRLSAPEALQRLEWARQCALLTNTNGPQSYISSTRAFDTTFNWAKEYVELNPNRSYTGNANSYNINYYYAYARYETTPVYTVFQEPSGPTAGFYKWSYSMPRARPLYPVFESSPVAGQGLQLIPLPTLPGAGCSLYLRDASGNYARWTGNFYAVVYCEADS